MRPSDAPAIPDRRPRLWPCPEHLPTSNTRRSRLSKTIGTVGRATSATLLGRSVAREYFDDVEERKYFVEPHIPAFADFRSWAGKRVLEIGCGIGTDTINFARARGSSHCCRLVRSLHRDCETAEARSSALRINRLFIHSNAETLEGVPLDPGYDLIYSFGVIHHTPRPDRVLQQAHRRLATGGTVKVMVYYRNSWKVGEIVLGYGKGRFWDLDALVGPFRGTDRLSGDVHLHEEDGHSAVRDRWSRVDKLEIDHIFPYRVKDYVEYRYVKRFPFNALPERASAALEHTLGWHLW